MSDYFPVVDKSITDLREALESGTVTCVDLVKSYLHRIEVYDHSGIRLNSVVELNPNALEDAQESDKRRATGASRGPLEGIPFTAKDSYMVKDMTVACGSPAFEHLVATRDAYSIEKLRDAGCVFIGLTNMPPMANGGMQRGLYGRAESPYNANFLTSAWASGSSNGSGTATAASFAAFGLAEETWSSGRAPASCNALCAYTPSRGLISTRGNWPLIPTMDVVAPHTRTMSDMCTVLDALVAVDPEVRGDFWRMQPWVQLPNPISVRPASFTALHTDARTAASSERPLAGARLAVPRMFIGTDPDQGTGTGVGTSLGARITPRPSMLDLWQSAREDLVTAGADIIESDFPVVTNYESDRPGASSIFNREIVPPEFFDVELWELSMWSWDLFLQLNAQPGLDRLALADGPRIFPRHPEDVLDQLTTDMDIDLADYVTRAREQGIIDPFNDERPISFGVASKLSNTRARSTLKIGSSPTTTTQSSCPLKQMSRHQMPTRTLCLQLLHGAMVFGCRPELSCSVTSVYRPSPCRWELRATLVCPSGSPLRRPPTAIRRSFDLQACLKHFVRVGLCRHARRSSEQELGVAVLNALD